MNTTNYEKSHDKTHLLYIIKYKKILLFDPIN